MSDEVQPVKFKIKRLPGAKLAPETVLAQAIEEAGNIKCVLVASIYKDGSIDIDFSSMQIDALCFIERHIHEVVTKQLFSDEQ